MGKLIKMFHIFWIKKLVTVKLLSKMFYKKKKLDLTSFLTLLFGCGGRLELATLGL